MRKLVVVSLMAMALLSAHRIAAPRGSRRSTCRAISDRRAGGPARADAHRHRAGPLHPSGRHFYRHVRAEQRPQYFQGHGRRRPPGAFLTPGAGHGGARDPAANHQKRGKVAALTFTYDGKLSGDEESPVFGIKFAAIHPEFSYLLYPSRWFPVNDYSTDRFSSDLKVTVPDGYGVVGSGSDSKETAPAGMASYRFKSDQPSFPGSFAVVKGPAQVVPSGGIKTYFYLRESSNMAQAYGEEIAKALSFFTSIYGSPPRLGLTIVETEAGGPKGYSAPGMLFLAPDGIGKQVNVSLIANQVSRQWFGALVSPTTRNHMWLENGLARYSEMLFAEHREWSRRSRHRDS